MSDAASDDVDAAWLYERLREDFIIDVDQRHALFTPKTVVYQILGEHLSGGERSARSMGQTWDALIQNTIAILLHAEPEFRVDACETFFTDQGLERSKKCKKARCFRFIAPKTMELVRDEESNLYRKIFSNNDRQLRRAVTGRPVVNRPAIASSSTVATSSSSGRPQRATQIVEDGEDDEWHAPEEQEEGEECGTGEEGEGGEIEGEILLQAIEEAGAGSDEVEQEGQVGGESDTEGQQQDFRLSHPLVYQDNIYVVEFFCGVATCVRQMRKRYGESAHCLLVDIRSPEECGIIDMVGDDHTPGWKNITFIQQDLKHLDTDEMKLWVEKKLGTTVDNIHRFHASVRCDSFAGIDQVNPNPARTVSGGIASDKAVQHNIIVKNLCTIVKFIRGHNSRCCISLENPAKGSFFQIRLVDELMSEKGWHLKQGDHCANASELLDGSVYGPVSRRMPKPPYDGVGGLYAKKPTKYGLTAIMPRFKLSECAGVECRMKVPDTDYHVLCVSKEKGKSKYGQRKVVGAGKAAVPLGVHDAIWKSHLEWMVKWDGSSFDCTVCGEPGSLLICEEKDCDRAQHAKCSRYDTLADPWYCNRCALEKDLI